MSEHALNTTAKTPMRVTSGLCRMALAANAQSPRRISKPIVNEVL